MLIQVGTKIGYDKDIGTCKFCGNKLLWKYSTYHKKNKPYDLNGERYHTCNYNPLKVIKMSREEIEALYGKPEPAKRKYAY
jgi:hypothetical protein